MSSFCSAGGTSELVGHFFAAHRRSHDTGDLLEDSFMMPKVPASQAREEGNYGWTRFATQRNVAHHGDCCVRFILISVWISACIFKENALPLLCQT
jgi:hypothetical protein